ncbi:hypothetical protein V496_00983 [Pseudogymnoascus sp. VKM F-4515 (FW-2607)]|nr:hypothetical protein V496_00983 [Pseudogymnoascus sp. VKM F-4515 (FW-2607)]
MTTTLELDGHKPITFTSAEQKEANIVHQLSYPPATAELREELWRERGEIKAIAKHHLGLGSDSSYIVLKQSTWIQGGFNICIPIEANLGKLSKKLVFRCPMPHKLAEGIYPGTVDEKLSFLSQDPQGNHTSLTFQAIVQKAKKRAGTAKPSLSPIKLCCISARGS